jgi:hypothetical protein
MVLCIEELNFFAVLVRLSFKMYGWQTPLLKSQSASSDVPASIKLTLGRTVDKKVSMQFES